MSTFGEINAKIIFWGLPYAGKSSNLARIHEKLRTDHRSDVQRMQFDDTPYEILPIELGQVQGRTTRFQIYSIPGAPAERIARLELSRGALGIVFVVDSKTSKLQENALLYQEMVEMLHEVHIEPIDFPVVVQYNKLDLPDAASVEEMQKKINLLNYPFFKSVAHQGTGVLPTLTTISKTVIRYLKDRGQSIGAAAQPTMTAPPLKAPAPAVEPRRQANLPPAAVELIPRRETSDTELLKVASVDSTTRLADGALAATVRLIDKNGKTFSTQLRLEISAEAGALSFKIA